MRVYVMAFVMARMIFLWRKLRRHLRAYGGNYLAMANIASHLPAYGGNYLGLWRILIGGRQPYGGNYLLMAIIWGEN